MKVELRLRPGDDVRAIWLIALGVLVAGFFYVQTRYQSEISAAYDRTEILYHRTLADTRLVQQASRLRTLEAQARDDLSRVSHDSSLAATTANLLGMLHASARTFDTRVEEVQPGNPQAGREALQATPLVIRLNGRFRNILAFVEDLSHHATLISVSDTEIALANDSQRDAAEPRLDATVHATLYRLEMPAEKELRVAPAR
ncbi:MAG TPA: type 4a pilus biogenesis protein PilO [Candidatus Baltobacteraceae bacterium]|nr:type 4a pilus biogenesis protein PilO [Candidatus Baltobacteraceae bacterium]